MFEIVALVAPFFAVIGCGYFGARIIGEPGQQGLNLFVRYFALPALLFSLMARGELATKFTANFVLAYTATSLLLVVLAYVLLAALFRRRQRETSVLVLGSVYGNIGYMGIPIVTMLLGARASVPAVIALMIDVIVIIPLMSAFIVADTENHQVGVLASTVRILLDTLRSPLIVAAFLGAGVSVSFLVLPQVIERLLDILSAAAAPCALFALGASLWGKPPGGNIRPALVVSLLKLIVHPLMLFVALTMVFTVDPGWAEAAVISASLPLALTVYVVAQQYDTAVLASSMTILVSTALSILTVPLILMLFRLVL